MNFYLIIINCEISRIHVIIFMNFAFLILSSRDIFKEILICPLTETYLNYFQMLNSTTVTQAPLMESSGKCVDFTEIYPDPTNSIISTTIFGIIYTHIFILGLLGNISMMFLTLRHRHLQTVQNIFILNLAMSDVLMCLLSVPITPITNIFKTWFFGEYICHLLPFVQVSRFFVY